ncbi:Uncharacterised protein [Bartonella grahamii]|uniref:Uncharacterized protein n=1 Tax=Bartonella grahamii TaxID=33045 RepID=A0A336NEB4_BARGR|nr:Uncharacterised protein [Bartonella grahamii]
MVGRVVSGLITLLISVIGLLFLGIGFFDNYTLITIPWALIDFIFILTGNFRDKDLETKMGVN